MLRSQSDLDGPGFSFLYFSMNSSTFFQSALGSSILGSCRKNTTGIYIYMTQNQLLMSQKQPCSKLGFLQTGLGKLSQLHCWGTRMPVRLVSQNQLRPKTGFLQTRAGHTVSTWSKIVQCWGTKVPVMLVSHNQPCPKTGFLETGLGNCLNLEQSCAMLRDKGASQVSVTEPASPQDWLPTD